jgi:hypothetical protein
MITCIPDYLVEVSQGRHLYMIGTLPNLGCNAINRYLTNISSYLFHFNFEATTFPPYNADTKRYFVALDFLYGLKKPISV